MRIRRNALVRVFDVAALFDTFQSGKQRVRAYMRRLVFTPDVVWLWTVRMRQFME